MKNHTHTRAHIFSPLHASLSTPTVSSPILGGRRYGEVVVVVWWGGGSPDVTSDWPMVSREGPDP